MVVQHTPGMSRAYQSPLHTCFNHQLHTQVRDPEAVEPEAGDAGEAEAGALPAPSRGSSEESETSALGL